jgi:siroheme synthase-like protein
MSGWSTLPVEVLVRGRRALVVGGGAECASKVRRLLEAGAIVRVVTGGAGAGAEILEASGGRAEICERPFSRDDLEGACVVFVAPAFDALGRELADEARRSGRLVSTLDRPEASTFINPAVARRSGLSIAISSGGAAPALVKRLREDLESILARAELGAFVSALASRRAALPRGARGASAGELVKGFRLTARLAFPRWFERPRSKRRPPRG